MAVFEDEIILNQIRGGIKNGFRPLGPPKGTVKLSASSFLRAIMLADKALGFRGFSHFFLKRNFSQPRLTQVPFNDPLLTTW